MVTSRSFRPSRTAAAEAAGAEAGAENGVQDANATRDAQVTPVIKIENLRKVLAPTRCSKTLTLRLCRARW